MQAVKDMSPRAAPSGLRERKKRRTRETLIRSALELFALKGYERTTVDEIAEAADVSQRTFFRYFANKEEVALAVQDSVESHFFTALRARPASESPLTALRSAVLASWDTVGEAIESVVPLELHMRTYRMIESTPPLLAAHLRRLSELEERLAREIADREGLDVATDPRPRVLVAAFGGVMRVTGKLWGEYESGGMEELRRLTTLYMDQLGPALAENWRT
ncbi:TetR family transcriptional regulator [Streptomyces sp. ISL-11]|uniref:TetR family transcriptional regulator n=1 Tax=Streptomyces sp. ISL-11 TaxID=2819174 RepID=UPI001BE5EF39|nr:TetR family transcriptional regulator [Streptomyces sp. ISL-11]MBT2383642.1 TetR family transcriptional regulator [Streptomyces sp. ISL-11]